MNERERVSSSRQKLKSHNVVKSTLPNAYDRLTRIEPRKRKGGDSLVHQPIAQGNPHMLGRESLPSIYGLFWAIQRTDKISTRIINLSIIILYFDWESDTCPAWMQGAQILPMNAPIAAPSIWLPSQVSFFGSRWEPQLWTRWMVISTKTPLHVPCSITSQKNNQPPYTSCRIFVSSYQYDERSEGRGLPIPRNEFCALDLLHNVQAPLTHLEPEQSNELAITLSITFVHLDLILRTTQRVL